MRNTSYLADDKKNIISHAALYITYLVYIYYILYINHNIVPEFFPRTVSELNASVTHCFLTLNPL